MRINTLVFFLVIAPIFASLPLLAAEQTGADRPLLSRAELSRLKKLDRAQVLAALGSFEDRGLSENQFVLQMGALFDARRVPGLAEALAAGNADAALAAVCRVCQPPKPAAGARSVSRTKRELANDVLVNRFTFYGETYQLPDDINWDHNPGTAHWGHDLNRFGYLDALTQTYLATGDTRYSRKAVALILDWIAKCDLGRCFKGSPYMFGSYLNNAGHCVAWANCVAALLPRGQVRPIELLRILKSLHDQLAYLEIVTNGHAGNWPVLGCRAMLDCAAEFPMLRDAGRFTDYAARTLASQIMTQVKPDGVQDELTPHYHRVVVNSLLAVVRPLRSLGRELDPVTLATLRKMVHYVQQTTVPDGSKQAAFNDSDPGSPGNIARELAALGLQDLLSPVEKLGPEFFPYAGVAFLRQRQDRGDLYLAFDAGPYGRGHQHEDKLGFWLFAYGRNFVVDPGRHLYDHSARSYYDYLKSTTAHSTIKIDGENQHSRGRRETWIPDKPLDLGWRVTKDEIRARGVYDLGYGPKNTISVIHRREIVFVRERCWVVFDSVEGDGEHLIESRFQFAPGKLLLDGGAARTDFKDANLSLHTVATVAFGDTHVEQGRENPRGGWYSDSYGKIEPAPALSMSVQTRLPWRSATLLFPWRGTLPPRIEFAWDGTSVKIRAPELGEARVECSLESFRNLRQ
ncbi:MAG: alginate lyase family protein [Verrucomicrobia bacterium]|nr:alginate lyase family protein [Verrucomicrobiota bacterium]